MVKTLLKCADLRTLPVGIASVLAGAAAAAVNGNFEWLTVSVCLLFIVCFQITANIVHRYSVVLQHSGEHVEEYIQYSQREMQFPLKKVLHEGIGVMGMLTIIFSLIIFQMGMGQWWMFLVAVVTVLALYLNSFGVYPLSKTPMNYVLTFLFFGPVAVVSVTYLQARYHAVDALTWHDLGPDVFCGIVAGIFAGNSVLVYNALNIEKDRHFGKHTLATIFGLKGTQLFLTLASVLAVGAAAFGSVLFMKSIWWISTLIVAGGAGVNVWVARRLGASSLEDYPRLTAWINWTSLAIQLVFVIIFLACGAPDTRGIDYL